MTPADFHAFTQSILEGFPARYHISGDATDQPNTLSAKVDRLGQLSANIAAIKKEAAQLRTELEAAGLSEIPGQNYRASFCPCKGKTLTDWQAIAAKFNPSRQLIAAHTTTGKESTRMTITAHPSH